MSLHLDFLQSGDLLFFKSYKSMPGVLVEWACLSPWCHVALVVTLPTHLIVDNEVVAFKGSKWVWESATGSDVPSLLPQKNGSHNKTTGAILTPLNGRLEGCGIVGIQKLRYEGDKDERMVREELNLALFNHIMRYHERCYETNMFDFVKVWCHSILCMEMCCLTIEPPACNSSETSFFCSEIVAKALLDAKVMCRHRRVLSEKKYWEEEREERLMCHSLPESCLCFIDCSGDDVVQPGEFTVSDLCDNTKLNAYYLRTDAFRYSSLIEANCN